MAKQIKQRRKQDGLYEYFRICSNCGAGKWMTYRPKQDALCAECAKTEFIKRHTKKEDEKVKYWYVCPTCPSVRVLSEKRKSNYCITCSRKHSKTIKPYYFFDFEILKVRTLRVKPKPLPKVKKKKIVTKKKEITKKKTTKAKVDAKVTKPKKKYARSEKIDPITLKKILEINRLHKKEEQEKQAKKVVQRKSDAEMIADFLKHKEPSVKINNEEFPLVYGGEMAMNPMLEWI